MTAGSWFTREIKEIKATPGFRYVKENSTEMVYTFEENHNTLHNSIYSCCAQALGYEVADEADGRWPLSLLFQFRNVLRPHIASDKNGLTKIIDAFEIAHQAALADRIKEDAILMEDVTFLFPPSTKVTVKTDAGEKISGTVFTIQRAKSFFSEPKLAIHLDVMHGLGGLPSQGRYAIQVGGWRGGIKIAELPLSKITDEEMAGLTERGMQIFKMMTPGTYCYYIGELFQPSWWSFRRYRADGRFVSDAISLEKMDPRVWSDITQNSGITFERGKVEALSEAQLKEDAWRAFPFVYGFSMPIKTWGIVNAEKLKPVVWNEKAFDSLVLPAEQKELVYNLVKHHGKGMTDFIEGKGGGCIFLLHGFPGEGKTATAESVAEVLQRPLYSVSTGELGVEPAALEENVRKLLDVAKIWNAVILLDEADIFLEARDQKDILRNAMVGIFLRLLEYHDGVLFLTTNRVKDIDKAFYSRISIALHYPKASIGKRKLLWEQLLKLAVLNPTWAAKLSVHDLNGRQIKNCIRMAQTLAIGGDRAVKIEDLERTIALVRKFQEDLLLQAGEVDEFELLEKGA